MKYIQHAITWLSLLLACTVFWLALSEYAIHKSAASAKSSTTLISGVGQSSSVWPGWQTLLEISDYGC